MRRIRNHFNSFSHIRALHTGLVTFQNVESNNGRFDFDLVLLRKDDRSHKTRLGLCLRQITFSVRAHLISILNVLARDCTVLRSPCCRRGSTTSSSSTRTLQSSSLRGFKWNTTTTTRGLGLGCLDDPTRRFESTGRPCSFEMIPPRCRLDNSAQSQSGRPQTIDNLSLGHLLCLLASLCAERR